MIKDSKLKVQAQIQGDEIRVTGKSRDDLQAVMAMVRGGDLGQPFQFKTSAINRDNLRFVHVRCSMNARFGLQRFVNQELSRPDKWRSRQFRLAFMPGELPVQHQSDSSLCCRFSHKLNVLLLQSTLL